MGNDLKYGLIFAGVVALAFVGWILLKGDNSAEVADEPVPVESTTATPEVDIFATGALTDSGSIIAQAPNDAVYELAPVTTGGSVVPRTNPVASAYPSQPGAGYRPSAPAGTAPTTLQPWEVSTPVVAPTAGQKYTIAKSDTLSSISRKFYGTPNKWQAIAAANADKISDPARLVVGTEIVIPDVQAPATPMALAADTTASGAGTTVAGKTHTVAKGDSLESIAKKYYGDGAKWRTILDANRDKVSKPEALRIGTVLTIP